jgi:hypothetical protein
MIGVFQRLQFNFKEKVLVPDSPPKPGESHISKISSGRKPVSIAERPIKALFITRGRFIPEAAEKHK